MYHEDTRGQEGVIRDVLQLVRLGSRIRHTVISALDVAHHHGTKVKMKTATWTTRGQERLRELHCREASIKERKRRAPVTQAHSRSLAPLLPCFLSSSLSRALPSFLTHTHPHRKNAASTHSPLRQPAERGGACARSRALGLLHSLGPRPARGVQSLPSDPDRAEPLP